MKMNTITLSKEKIYSGNLLLVNAQYPLKNRCTDHLVTSDNHYPEILMKRIAVNFLQLILEKISAGGSIVIVSGYRSFEEQTAIFEGSLKENGEEFTRKYVALPGHSEHQTGLAVDLALNQGNIDFICPEFPYDGICNQFRKIASDYGFIQRYTKDKEQITGISNEPWHLLRIIERIAGLCTKGELKRELQCTMSLLSMKVQKFLCLRMRYIRFQATMQTDLS